MSGDRQENVDSRPEPAVVLVAGCVLPNDLTIERERLEPLGVELVDGRNLPRQALNHQLARATALLTEGFIGLDEASLGRMRGCKVISFYSIGVETVDLDAASRRGIIVTNAPGYCTDEVADHTIFLLLAAWRKAAVATRLAADKSWDLGPLRPILGLRGKTLGLVGYGGIARAVAARARAFGMAIVAHDPFVAQGTLTDPVALVSLDTLFATSDVVSLHLPLTSRTRGLVGRDLLALLGENAVVVNTSRGEVIDEAALVEALERGRIAGAGLDVLATEPASSGTSRRLLQLERAICTPHMAYYSEEAVLNVRRLATDAAASVLAGELPPDRSWVNRDRFASSPAAGG